MTPSRSSSMGPSRGWRPRHASPPGPGARARRGPGRPLPRLAGPARASRPSGSMPGCTGSRQRLPRPRAPSPSTADRGRGPGDRTATAGDPTDALGDRGIRQRRPATARRARSLIVVAASYYLGMPLTDVAGDPGDIPVGTVEVALASRVAVRCEPMPRSRRTRTRDPVAEGNPA